MSLKKSWKKLSCKIRAILGLSGGSHFTNVFNLGKDSGEKRGPI